MASLLVLMLTRPAASPAGLDALPPPAIRAAISSGAAAKSMVSPVATANLVSTTEDRRTGVASRWMLLPSSISAPSTLVPMIRAVSGISTENPNVPRTCDGHGRIGAREALSASVNRMRIAAGSANSSARLRLSVARRVIHATVGLNKADMLLLDWLGRLGRLGRLGWLGRLGRLGRLSWRRGRRRRFPGTRRWVETRA